MNIEKAGSLIPEELWKTILIFTCGAYNVESFKSSLLEYLVSKSNLLYSNQFPAYYSHRMTPPSEVERILMNLKCVCHSWSNMIKTLVRDSYQTSGFEQHLYSQSDFLTRQISDLVQAFNTSCVFPHSTLKLLTNCTRLRLPTNEVTSDEVVSCLTKLSQLWLTGNSKMSLNVTIPKLTELSLLPTISSTITIPIVEGLTHLKKLYIWYEEDFPMEILSHFSYLRSLRLRFHFEDPIPDLSLFTNLTELELAAQDVIGLYLLTNLTALSFCEYYHLYAGVESLSHMTKLTVEYVDFLDQYGNEQAVDCVTHFAKLTQVRDLTLYQCVYLSNDCLQVFTNLFSLRLSDIISVNDESMKYLTVLKCLSLLGDTAISDYGAAQLTSLLYLDLKHLSDANSHFISDSAIAKLTNLTFLDLGPHHKNISQAALKHLRNLKYFDYAAENECSKYPEIEVAFVPMSERKREKLIRKLCL